jgi:hypothetical protein
VAFDATSIVIMGGNFKSISTSSKSENYCHLSFCVKVTHVNLWDYSNSMKESIPHKVTFLDAKFTTTDSDITQQGFGNNKRKPTFKISSNSMIPNLGTQIFHHVTVLCIELVVIPACSCSPLCSCLTFIISFNHNVRK